MSDVSRVKAVELGRSILISAVLAAAVYFMTEQILFSLAVVGVAVTIAAASYWKGRSGRQRDVSQAGAVSDFNKLLVHERVSVRFIALFALSSVLFVGAWYISYWFLPAGILTVSRAESITVQVSTGVIGELATILAWNLTLPLLVIVGGNILLRIHRLPLGYIMPALWSLWYGVTIGTNSFAVPMTARMAPSLAVLGRAGPYEFAGYCLIAVATYSLARYQFTDFLAGELIRIKASSETNMDLFDWIGLIVGVMLVIGAGWREAIMILAA